MFILYHGFTLLCTKISSYSRKYNNFNKKLVKLQLVVLCFLSPEVDIVNQHVDVAAEAESVPVHDEIMPDTETEMFDSTHENLHCALLRLRLQ